MGCCYSLFCKEDSSSQNDEPNETTSLLPNMEDQSFYRNQHERLPSVDHGPLPKKTDEQSALARILQETATNVIDVAALDSQNVQQHEYLEKMRQYNSRVNSICLNKRQELTNNFKHCILDDIPNTEAVLTADPLEPDDKTLIRNALEKAVSAIAEIKVEHKEDLVVPFRISC